MKLPENEIDLEAIRWALLAEKEPLSAEQQHELSTWLSAKTKHQGAYVRARALLLHLERLGALAGGRYLSTPPPLSHVTRRTVLAASLSAVGVLGAGGWFGRDWIAEAWHGVRYMTDIGQVRTVQLVDGSAMTLNTATEAWVHYGRGRREVRLARGEALFEVVHEARPFLVRMGELTVRAVGTAFAARRESLPGESKVIVTQGAVEILSRATSEEFQTPQPLAANQEAVITDDSVVEVRTVSTSEAQRRLAWRKGILVFDGQPLRAVIGELNRYSRREMVVNDDDLAARPVVGIFRATDTQTFISSLEFTMGARAVESSNGKVVLRPTRVNTH